MPGKKTHSHSHNDAIEFDILDRDKHGQITQDEQVRLIFSGAILAGFFAYIQIGHTVAIHIGLHPARAIGLTLALSGLFSFLYLLTVGAALKHTQVGYIDGYKIDFIQKFAFFDLSVDMLAIAPFAALIDVTRNYNFVKTSGIVLAIALIGVTVLYVFPAAWTRYEIEASCPECAKAFSHGKKMTKWRALKPKLIKWVISSLLFLIILIIANEFV